MKSQKAGPKKKPPNIAELTIGEIIKGMRPAEFWSLCIAAVCLVTAVATLAFKLGQMLR
jgi:hypothetical protein